MRLSTPPRFEPPQATRFRVRPRVGWALHADVDDRLHERALDYTAELVATFYTLITSCRSHHRLIVVPRRVPILGELV